MFDLGWSNHGQITSYLAACDALIVPSRWEGFGLVATEAMRAGKAVICSNRGGLKEVVEDGVTGIVLDELTSTRIAEVLGGLSAENLLKMGQAGKQRFRALFTADKMHKNTKQTYLNAVAQIG